MVVSLAILGVEHSHTPGKVQAMRANPGVNLLGAFEADPAVREARQSHQAFAGVHWFSSQEELLAAEGLQGVIIDGYARHNIAMAQAALQADKSILLEKPAGTQPGDLEGLQALARANGAYIQLGYQFRYMPAFEFAHQIVQDGLLGELFFFRARISKAESVYEQLLPELSLYQGGTFFELGCHILDMGIILLGAPTRVQRVLRTDYGSEPRFADNTVAVVEFAGGIGLFESSAMEVDPKRRIEIYGTKGSIIMQPIMPTEVELCLEEAHAPYVAGWQRVPVGERAMFSQDIVEFIAVINGDKEPEYSPEQTLLTQRTLLAICQGA